MRTTVQRRLFDGLHIALLLCCLLSEALSHGEFKLGQDKDNYFSYEVREQSLLCHASHTSLAHCLCFSLPVLSTC